MEQSTKTPPALDFSAYQTPLHTGAIVKALHIRDALKELFFSLLFFGVFLGFLSEGFQKHLTTGILIFSICLLPFLVKFIRTLKHRISQAKQELRLQAFAPANGLQYEAKGSPHDLPGMLFRNIESESHLTTLVSGTYHQVPFFVSNAFIVTGSAKSRAENWYGVIRVKLSRKVPHILLDSRHNNFLGLSNLRRSVHSNQRLQLEGDFNTHFNLYVPQGYERDALYFITPELMALLIDKGATFDVELIDDNLFIYSSKRFRLEDPAKLADIFHIIDTLGVEFEANTHRYADANIGNRAANVVAPAGQRLKRSVPWVLILLIALYILYIFL